MSAERFFVSSTNLVLFFAWIEWLPASSYSTLSRVFFISPTYLRRIDGLYRLLSPCVGSGGSHLITNPEFPLTLELEGNIDGILLERGLCRNSYSSRTLSLLQTLQAHDPMAWQVL